MANQQRIFVARRAGDGLVHIGALEAPAERIQLFTEYGIQLDEHIVTRPTSHAARVVQALKRRFDRAAVEHSGPWFVIEYSRAVKALGEYNLDTGERTADGVIALHSTVWVEGLGTGKVSGFSPCGRVEVRFDRRFASLVTCAPRSMVSVIA